MIWTALISATTAFIISAGGSITVGLVAGKGTMSKEAWALAVAIGAMSAAKDLRSLFKLPPVNGATEPKP